MARLSGLDLAMIAGIVASGAGIAWLTLEEGVAAREVSKDPAFLSTAQGAGYSVEVESGTPFDRLVLRCTKSPPDACGPSPAIQGPYRPRVVLK